MLFWVYMAEELHAQGRENVGTEVSIERPQLDSVVQDAISAAYASNFGSFAQRADFLRLLADPPRISRSTRKQAREALNILKERVNNDFPPEINEHLTELIDSSTGITIPPRISPY